MGTPRKMLPRTFAIHEDKESVPSAQPLLRQTSSTMPLMASTVKTANGSVKADASKRLKFQETSAIEALMAKLSEQQQNKQNACLVHADDDSSSSITDPFATTPPMESALTDTQGDTAEVLRLKRQLELATERMAQMDLEINQSRLARQTVEQAIGSPFPSNKDLAFHMPAGFNNDIHLPDSGRGSPLHFLNQAHPMTFGGNAQSTHFNHDSMMHAPEPAGPYNRSNSRFSSQVARLPGITPPMTPFDPANQYSLMGGSAFPRQAPIGTALSPTAVEFNTWQPLASQPGQSTYLSTAEPLNYRRLLDRNMSCNWRYIVDKIVCNNDQQASIFLQQKLKIGTSDQKFEIVQAIIDQAYPLMVNRFGNFLVQRCFEHGTPEQIVAIAQAIRGNTLNLSMDPFGCHVVQKAFDYVPEEYKAIMVHELLRRIPETVIHRYACHVWQKLFELRWSDSPPQIMRYVNESLRGMWHEVALGETGSLVVQNIFENCLEEDKRPCINEVLASIDVVAHGQFGNWCIQHICEHGMIPDRTRAVDHVLRYAAEYSTDQFASKVVEKCLKIGGADFLDRYLDCVCESRPDRPRMPLIDIAGDQFGNYLIQHILTNADSQRREVVAAHVRKHMVSLRGSKYGSRVAMLCCNPAFTTRPGPPGPLSRSNGRFQDQFGGETGSRTYDRGYMGMSRGAYAPYRGA